jgi:hypothetical protein
MTEGEGKREENKSRFKFFRQNLFPFSVEFQLGSKFLPHLHPTADESRGRKD